MDIIEKAISCLRSTGKKGIAGIWLDEHKLVKAAARARQSGLTKFDAISPFPIHGIDDAMGIPFSWIPWVTFIFGLGGFAFGTWFTWWASAVDWPLNIGGKPFWSLPAFVPVMFELTILFGALSSVGALILVCGLPKIDPPVIDPDLTSHKFALFVPEDDTGFNAAQVESMFKEMGAVEVRRAEF